MDKICCPPMAKMWICLTYALSRNSKCFFFFFFAIFQRIKRNPQFGEIFIFFYFFFVFNIISICAVGVRSSQYNPVQETVWPYDSNLRLDFSKTHTRMKKERKKNHEQTLTIFRLFFSSSNKGFHCFQPFFLLFLFFVHFIRFTNSLYSAESREVTFVR